MQEKIKTFDIVIVGAGPAGGNCARILAKSGRKVLLAEQNDNFYKNDFSSAATPYKPSLNSIYPNQSSAVFGTN